MEHSELIFEGLTPDFLKKTSQNNILLISFHFCCVIMCLDCDYEQREIRHLQHKENGNKSIHWVIVYTFIKSLNLNIDSKYPNQPNSSEKSQVKKTCLFI